MYVADCINNNNNKIARERIIRAVSKLRKNYPNQSVVSPLNLYRSPCVAACLAPESDTKLVPGDTGYPCTKISRTHLIAYIVEDGISSSVHAKHTFSRTSRMLRIDEYRSVPRTPSSCWPDTYRYSIMHRRLPTACIEVAPHYHQLLVVYSVCCRSIYPTTFGTPRCR